MGNLAERMLEEGAIREGLIKSSGRGHTKYARKYGILTKKQEGKIVTAPPAGLTYRRRP